MKGLLTFPAGGVHPPDGKKLSSACAVKIFRDIDEYVVPLSQHLGSPAEPVVEPGDKVEEGMCIGKANGYISAHVHSPVCGTVKELTEITLATGQKSKAVVIQRLPSEGKRYVPQTDWEHKSAAELIGLIQDAGVTGMGGAAFPSHVKITVPRGYTARVLVINGVECEPYLTSDHRLMCEEADRIFGGIRVLKKILSIDTIIVGIEKNKPDALRIMMDAAERHDPGIQVVALKVKYPQGDEKQLLKAILKKEVPSGKLPIELGAVVVNVSTAAAIYDAVVCGKALYERNVTVTGEAVTTPGNYRVKVGTPVRLLLEECGWFSREPAKIIAGGPMMGFSLLDFDTPVTKGTSGILVLGPEEAPCGKTSECIACGRCVSACPMGLMPSLLFKMIDHQDYTSASGNGLLDCKECGCCAYSCPAHIPLVNGFKAGKYESRRMQGRKK